LVGYRHHSVVKDEYAPPATANERRGSADGTGFRASDIPAPRGARRGGAALAGLLAACGGPTATATTAPTATTAVPAATVTSGGAAPTVALPGTRPAGAGAPAIAAATSTARVAATGGAATATRAGASPAAATTPIAIRIQNRGAPLPSGQVTVRWLEAGPGPRTTFFKQYFAAYKQAHANITVQFDSLPAPDRDQAVQLGFQNGNAPDIFELPSTITGAQAVREGWVAPLDDVIPDFAAWKAAFPAGAFLDGITTFGGKTYTFGIYSPKQYTTLTFFNSAYLQAAGYDPSAAPLTWDTFRAAARKVTAQGVGKYYGMIIGAKEITILPNFVRNLGRMAGPALGDDIDWKTGRYAFTSDGYLAAIDLLMALVKDGSIFPGSVSFSGADARDRMAQGAAGLWLSGTNGVANLKAAPNLAFGIGSQPIPNSGTPQPLTYTPGVSGNFWLYAKSGAPTVGGDLLAYLGTVEGQTTFQAINGAGQPALFPQADKAIELDPRTRKGFNFFEQQMRMGPSPLVRNPDIEQVFAEQKRLTPDFG